MTTTVDSIESSVAGRPGHIRTVTMEERKHQARSAALFTAAGLVGAIGAGFAFKNGLKQGFRSVASISKFICSIVAIPVVFLFPVTLLISEFNFLKGRKKGGDERINWPSLLIQWLVFLLQQLHLVIH